MKVIFRIASMIALVGAGFAAGFPVGQSRGFSTGSEWALVQADILAREAGLFMPVNFKAGQFTVTLKQPKHLYTRAWKLADKHEVEMAYLCRGDKTLLDRKPLSRHTFLLQ